MSNHDIDFIDLLSDFRNASQEQRLTLYRFSDAHWNPAGHRLAAERVTSHLNDNGYLLPSESSDISKP